MSKHNQLTKELEELNVLNSELKNLKKTARVYRQQPNSHIFFLDDISNVKCKTKGKNLFHMKIYTKNYFNIQLTPL
ncbi:ASNSD1 upstream open reading frame protein-like [Centruroides sculpturatus]|uniref:ASNSD1 upstream open reading frame protein-like n=1 Tax=Centruroides sculpturatus TaxID=218467 RepID=UPI000C6CE5F4|nr:ASNSD1 upstream open reading frame protein-like [Centruroides sculpturatus]